MLVSAPVRRSAPTVLAFPSGRFRLGALSPDQAVETIFPAAQVKKSAGQNAATRALMVQAATAQQLLNPNGQPAYIPGSGDCAGAPLSKKPAVISSIGGTAVKMAAVSGPAAPFVLAAGIVLNVAGFITGIFSHHHAAAVAKEQGTLCTAVPGANNALMAIDAAYSAGQMTGAQVLQALDDTVSAFQSEVSGILKGSAPTSSQCNAACVMLSQLRSIVAEKKSQYQDLIAAAAASPIASATSSIDQAISTGNVSSVLPWAAAALGLFLILKEG